jgi:hypothetical protein
MVWRHARSCSVSHVTFREHSRQELYEGSCISDVGLYCILYITPHGSAHTNMQSSAHSPLTAQPPIFLSRARSHRRLRRRRRRRGKHYYCHHRRRPPCRRSCRRRCCPPSGRQEAASASHHHQQPTHRNVWPMSSVVSAQGGGLAAACAACRRRIEGGAKKRCGGCRTISYCSAECSRADWPTHKVGPDR